MYIYTNTLEYEKDIERIPPPTKLLNKVKPAYKLVDFLLCKSSVDYKILKIVIKIQNLL